MNAVDLFEREYVHRNRGRTLIVGARVYPGREDRRLLFENVEGWDMVAGEGVDKVVDLELPLAPDFEHFSHVECISVLEHAQHPWLLAENIERLLYSGGTLYLSVPFVWRLHDYPQDLWRFTADGIRSLFKRIEWSALKYAERTLEDLVRGVHIESFPYFPRTQVLGFGRKR
jgi:SAM-dependent methyltransferase